MLIHADSNSLGRLQAHRSLIAWLIVQTFLAIAMGFYVFYLILAIKVRFGVRTRALVRACVYKHLCTLARARARDNREREQKNSGDVKRHRHAGGGVEGARSGLRATHPSLVQATMAEAHMEQVRGARARPSTAPPHEGLSCPTKQTERGGLDRSRGASGGPALWRRQVGRARAVARPPAGARMRYYSV